jgi:hypothetical protein
VSAETPARPPPVPVDVTNAEPLPVVITNAVQDDPRPLDVRVTNAAKAPAGPAVQSQVLDPSVPARTTFQEDLTTAGQRRINLIWEYTQSAVTCVVVLTNMLVAGILALRGGSPMEHPVILSSSLFLILGFYYSRTNHAAIGGVGAKAQAPYEGR